MRAAQVKLGGIYLAKVSGNLVKVQVESSDNRGGWFVHNLSTNRVLHFKTAGKLRPWGGS